MVKIALFSGLISFFLTLASSKIIINLMKSREIGQYIRNWGPKVHEHKSGTPTMGGLAILFGLGATVPLIWFYSPETRNYLFLFLLGTFGFGAIGFVDDLMSLLRGKAKGLTPAGKLVAQIGLGLIFVYLTFQLIELPNQLILPYSSLTLLVPPPLFYLFTIIILVGTVNAVNLTDGLDGLAGGGVLISVLGFLAISGTTQIPFFSALIASTLGFLWHNFYPARIFMGDTGAFALGGFLATSAVVTGTGLLLPLFGGLFVLETVSVIIQVSCYRLTGKRIFKISPLHHHFESADGIDYGYFLPKIEWEETTITTRLLIIHTIIVGLGLFGYYGWAA